MNRSTRLTLAGLAVAAYAGSILLANWLTSNYGLVSVGFGLVATAGTYAAGLALLLRDGVQRIIGIPGALLAMAGGIVLSAVLSDPHVALASAVAFGTAEVVDLLVYTPVSRYGWGRAVLASNAVSAPVDTVVFLAIAGFPITWAAVAGQLVGKWVWATLLPLVPYAATLLVRARRPETLREAINRDLGV